MVYALLATRNWKLNCWGSKTQPISSWVSPKYRISRAVCSHCSDSSHLSLWCPCHYQRALSLHLPVLAGWEVWKHHFQLCKARDLLWPRAIKHLFYVIVGEGSGLAVCQRLGKKWLSPCVTLLEGGFHNNTACDPVWRFWKDNLFSFTYRILCLLGSQSAFMTWSLVMHASAIFYLTHHFLWFLASSVEFGLSCHTVLLGWILFPGINKTWLLSSPPKLTSIHEACLDMPKPQLKICVAVLLFSKGSLAFM